MPNEAPVHSLGAVWRLPEQALRSVVKGSASPRAISVNSMRSPNPDPSRTKTLSSLHNSVQGRALTPSPRLVNGERATYTATFWGSRGLAQLCSVYAWWCVFPIVCEKIVRVGNTTEENYDYDGVQVAGHPRREPQMPTRACVERSQVEAAGRSPLC